MSPTVPALPLRQEEAADRAARLRVHSYELDLDLTGEGDTFASRTVVRFSSEEGPTFLDLKPVTLLSATLDGAALDVASLSRGRLPLALGAGEHEVVVEAVMPFRTDGEGLHRSLDAADGRRYVYGMSFMDAAPSVFACFDQPDLKAPYTVRVSTPSDWIVRGNGRAEQVEPGRWHLATTPPLATYFVTIVAGPYHVVESEHDGIRLSFSAKQSLAARLDAQAEELFAITGQCFDELHRLFGVRYAFGDYHQAFVQEFNAGAMENPGCVTIRDELVLPDSAARSEHVWRAALIAHEMAHQWFGDLVTPRWWDDLWLNESFAEYLGNRVAAEATEFSDAWTEVAYGRRQWGLSADLRSSTHPVAGNGAEDAPSALQNFDGISYAKGSSILRQINTTLGDEAFFGGVRALFEERRFGTVELSDVVAAWEQASGRDLGPTVRDWLLTSGPDVLALDREAGVVRRSAPAHDPDVARTHRIGVARSTPSGWSIEEHEVEGELALDVAADEAVVLDPRLDTWAAVLIDDESAALLVDRLAAVEDPLLVAAVWNNVRTSVGLARLAPSRAVDLLEAAYPLDDTGFTARRIHHWVRSWLLSLAPEGSVERLHRTIRGLLDAAEEGSEHQATAFRAALATCTDPAVVRGWLEDPPAGVDLDDEGRWRLLVRLAGLGAIDRAALDEALEAERNDRTLLGHARAVASLPTAEAKAWAWQRFTGEVEVPNHELAAIGAGFWQGGQEELTGPYVSRYFDDLPDVVARRSGWVLAESAEIFFPGVLDAAVLERARAAAADETLPAPVRRRIGDQADDLAARLAVLEAYPR